MARTVNLNRLSLTKIKVKGPCVYALTVNLNKLFCPKQLKLSCTLVAIASRLTLCYNSFLSNSNFMSSGSLIILKF